MTRDLPGFDNAVIGLGAGMFYVGYFLLEIPGSLIVERWSARRWLARILVTWGVMAALTAAVRTPGQFYLVRFLLGLAEAGFFPGVVVYLSHWFTERDRSRALSLFFVAAPMAQLVSPKVSGWLLGIGSGGAPPALGMVGWQWIYVAWGLPAVVLGVAAWALLPDRPRDARWLAAEERDALEQALARERDKDRASRHIGALAALRHPTVWLLAATYFCMVTASLGTEFFLPSILRDWYGLGIGAITTLLMIPPLAQLGGQLFVGWSSDRMRERRLHIVVPMIVAAVALGLAAGVRGSLPLTVAFFVMAAVGLKAYMPAFWALPTLLLGGSAAAGSVGLINSVGSLGGLFGPYLMGKVETLTGSFRGGIALIGLSVLGAVTLVLTLVFRRHGGMDPAGARRAAE
jgi:ACS family tartrate transporter-like MFS transporter